MNEYLVRRHIPFPSEVRQQVGAQPMPPNRDMPLFLQCLLAPIYLRREHHLACNDLLNMTFSHREIASHRVIPCRDMFYSDGHQVLLIHQVIHHNQQEVNQASLCLRQQQSLWQYLRNIEVRHLQSTEYLLSYMLSPLP